MQKGDFVRINFVGRLESGEIFDLTDEETAKKEKIHSEKIKYGPIPVVIGAGFVIPGLDRELMEMSVGEKRSVVIEPKDAFGDRDPKLVQTVPQKAFRDQKVEPRQGMIVDFGTMKGRIQSASAGRVRVDFNNPLAGKALKYELEIKEKIDSPADQVKAVFEFFGFKVGAEIQGSEAVIETALPHEAKQRLSRIILDNVKGVEKVTYKESFSRDKQA